MSNQLVLEMVKNLKKASAEHDAPIWSRLATMALKPASTKRKINLKRINQLTKEDDVVVIPGKVLGTGNMSHKITLCSFSISNSALNKIIDSGGKIISFSNIIKQFPTGKGVFLLG